MPISNVNRRQVLKGAAAGSALAALGGAVTARRTMSAAAVGTLTPATTYATTVTGDGTTSSFTVNHGLPTSDVAVQLRDDAGTVTAVGVQVPGPGTVLLTFAVPPPSGTTYHVVVIG